LRKPFKFFYFILTYLQLGLEGLGGRDRRAVAAARALLHKTNREEVIVSIGSKWSQGFISAAVFAG